MRRRVEQAWRLRWVVYLVLCRGRRFGASLLELRPAWGSDGEVPLSHEVVVT